jgi:hypothetical protein
LTSFRKLIVIAFLLLASFACQSRKEPIQQLQDQLISDSIALQKLQNNCQERLWADFRWCDSMLQYVPKEQVNDYFDHLNIAQAYLNQFDEMLPIMQHDISYTRQQLSNLKSDIDTHFIDEAQAALYLEDETAVADTIHQRILYFQDRLSQQDQSLKSTKKSIQKAVKP